MNGVLNEFHNYLSITSTSSAQMKSNEIFILLLFYFACQVVNLIHQFLKKERNKIYNQYKIFKINSFGILCIIVTRIPLKPFKTIVLWELNQIEI